MRTKFLTLTLIIIGFTTLGAQRAEARDQESIEAQKAIINALESYESVKKLKKRITHVTTSSLSEVTPLEKKTIVTLGALALSAARGKVTTRDLKLKQSSGNLSFEPVLEYDFETKSAGSVNLNYNF